MKCGTCKFFETETGTCHRCPPRGGAYSPGVFPQVKPDGWCGEYGAVDLEPDNVSPESESPVTDAGTANSGDTAQGSPPPEGSADGPADPAEVETKKNLKGKRKYSRRNK